MTFAPGDRVRIRQAWHWGVYVVESVEPDGSVNVATIEDDGEPGDVILRDRPVEFVRAAS